MAATVCEMATHREAFVLYHGGGGDAHERYIGSWAFHPVTREEIARGNENRSMSAMARQRIGLAPK